MVALCRVNLARRVLTIRCDDFEPFKLDSLTSQSHTTMPHSVTPESSQAQEDKEMDDASDHAPSKIEIGADESSQIGSSPPESSAKETTSNLDEIFDDEDDDDEFSSSNNTPLNITYSSDLHKIL